MSTALKITRLLLSCVAICLVILAILLVKMRSSFSSVSEIDSISVNGGMVTLYCDNFADPSWLISYRYSALEEKKGGVRRMHALEFSRQVPERGRVSVYGAPDENILLMATTGKSPVLLGIYVVDNDISHTHISLIGRDQTERDMVFAIARKYCPKSANDHWFDSLNGEYVIP